MGGAWRRNPYRSAKIVGRGFRARASADLSPPRLPPELFHAESGLEERRNRAEREVETAEQTGDRWRVGLALMNLATVCMALQCVDDATKYYEDSVANLERAGDNHALGLALVNLAEAHQQLGRVEEAIRSSAKGHRLLSEPTRNVGSRARSLHAVRVVQGSVPAG
jgi:tetratricopeptide (TPR) repeat protein